MAFLTVAVACILVASYSSMRQAFPYAHMEMIPIEMEGWSLSASEKRTDYKALQDGCEATVIRKLGMSWAISFLT